MRAPWYEHYEPRVPRKLSYPAVPLDRFLADAARRYPDHTATVYFGGRLSFRQLDGLANRFCHALPSLGFSPGDRVALMLPNTPALVAAYFGILRARGTVVQVNPLLAAAEVAHQIKDSGARILVTLPRFDPITVPLLHDGALGHLVLTEVEDGASPLYRLLIPLSARLKGEARGDRGGPGRVAWKALVAGRSEAAPAAEAKPRDLALIQYTGGTTGVSKGAMLSHANLVANTLQCRAVMHDLKEGPGGDVFLGAIPYFHVYGMTVCMNLAVYGGCTQVLLPRFESARVLKNVRAQGCTIFPGVSAMYHALNQTRGARRGDLATVRACISGAGPLFKEVQERFESLTGGRVVEGYGLTEASPVTHCNPVFGRRKPGTIGIPLPDTLAKVVDEATGRRALPAGRVGELAVKGPQVMLGYWRKRAETRRALRGGWLYTGDLAVMDKEGYFRIAERKKDMIKTRGENVYPRRIEEILMKHPGVADVVVVGLPDKVIGESIKVYVVARNPAPGRD